MIDRRTMLAAVATSGAAVLAGTLPRATASTDLDAGLEVVDARLNAGGKVVDVTGLTLQITNHRPPGGDVLTPVPSVWGVDRETQVAWRPEYGDGDWVDVQPGDTRTIAVAPPRPAPTVNLRPRQPAMVRVYDRGTERDASTVFTPADVADWGVADR